MSVATEVVYVDGTTAVSAAWLNLIQEHLAGFVNLRVSAAGQVVTISAAADNDAASVYINGEMRSNESDIITTFTGAEATNTYDVYVVGDVASDLFTMEVVSGAPAGTKTRKVAEVDYDTTLDVFTDLRMVRGELEEHDHTALSGAAQIAHGDLDGAGADDIHTQYALADGSRDYSGVVVGVDPVAGSDIATKGYVDGLVSSGIPVGTIVPYAGSTAPTGWFLCDGTSYLDATYPLLNAVLNDLYGGDGTNFNVPDLRGVLPFGKPVAGTGSALADTGGDLDHTHTQPTNTHDEVAHSHTIVAHTHTSPTTASDGDHLHTQSSTGNDGDHTHTGGSHTHAVGTLAVAATAGATTGARNGSTVTAGLFAENDLDTASDSSSHSHDDGTLAATGAGAITGSTQSNTFSHSHIPSNNGKEHTHTSGAVSGSSGAGGTGASSSDGDHSHANPSTNTTGAHTHTIGTSGSALTTTEASTAGTTTAAGGDTTGSANPPFQVLNHIVKHD